MNEELKDNTIRRLTSRKLHIAVVGFVAATALLATGNLSSEMWVDFIKWIFAIYAGGNVGEHLSNALEKYSNN